MLFVFVSVGVVGVVYGVVDVASDVVGVDVVFTVVGVFGVDVVCVCQCLCIGFVVVVVGGGGVVVAVVTAAAVGVVILKLLSFSQRYFRKSKF